MWTVSELSLGKCVVCSEDLFGNVMSSTVQYSPSYCVLDSYIFAEVLCNNHWTCRARDEKNQRGKYTHHNFKRAYIFRFQMETNATQHANTISISWQLNKNCTYFSQQQTISRIPLTICFSICLRGLLQNFVPFLTHMLQSQPLLPPKTPAESLPFTDVLFHIHNH